jgi:hypothetical protein
MPEEPDVWAYEREVLTRPPTPEDLELEEAYHLCIQDPGVQEKYAGQLVVAQKGTVWGAGKTWKEAWNSALSRPGSPEKRKLVCVLVTGLPLVPVTQPQQGKPDRMTRIPYPGDSGTTPTGALQFQNDWPGLFIRGDDAISLMGQIRLLLERLTNDDDFGVQSALGCLKHYADLIDRDVIVR